MPQHRSIQKVMPLRTEEPPDVLWGHVLPFALWIAFILILHLLEWARLCPRWLPPWSYAIKSVACAALFLRLKPWRTYAPLSTAHLPLAIIAGLAVAALWITPETETTAQLWPEAQTAYHRWLIMMPGQLPDYFDPTCFPTLPPGHAANAYAPAEAGWFLTIMRILGSAGVIAIIEEFFFRGFLYRWLQRKKFWQLPLRHFDAQTFMIVVALFALEHDRWFAGLLAGAVYGWLVLKTGNIWSAAVAHATTNLVLGIYVVTHARYGFW